jgi:hypothetical protein
MFRALSVGKLWLHLSVLMIRKGHLEIVRYLKFDDKTRLNDIEDMSSKEEG